MQRYVVGLAFSEKMQEVVLIHKQHGPKCVVGKWNGVGGHVERGEQSFDAMVREFEEETGATTYPGEWNLFVTLSSRNVIVDFFYLICDDVLNSVQTMTDEEIRIENVDNLPTLLMHNLKWMIPFLCDPTIEHSLSEIYMSDPEI